MNIARLNHSEISDVKGILSTIYRADFSTQSIDIIEQVFFRLSALDLSLTSDANATFMLSMLRKVHNNG